LTSIISQSKDRRNVLITGVNQGIGYALSKNYMKQGDKVFAVCRKSTQALQDLTNVTIIDDIDITDDHKLADLKNKLSGITFDIVINNAGIMTEEVLGGIKSEDLVRQFMPNIVAHLNTTQELRENLSLGSKVVFITSRMGVC